MRAQSCCACGSGVVLSGLCARRYGTTESAEVYESERVPDAAGKGKAKAKATTFGGIMLARPRKATKADTSSAIAQVGERSRVCASLHFTSQLCLDRRTRTVMQWCDASNRSLVWQRRLCASCRARCIVTPTFRTWRATLLPATYPSCSRITGATLSLAVRQCHAVVVPCYVCDVVCVTCCV